MASDPNVVISGSVSGATKLHRRLGRVTVGVDNLLGKGRLEGFLLRRVKERFKPPGGKIAQRDPSGNPWAKLKDGTKRRINLNRSQVLVESGKLRDAIQIVRSNLSSISALASPTGAGFYIGIPLGHEVAKYARLHNNGGRTGKGVRIPRRRFLGISREDVKAVDNLLRREMRKWTR